MVGGGGIVLESSRGVLGKVACVLGSASFSFAPLFASAFATFSLRSFRASSICWRILCVRSRGPTEADRDLLHPGAAPPSMAIFAGSSSSSNSSSEDMMLSSLSIRTGLGFVRNFLARSEGVGERLARGDVDKRCFA